MSDYNARTDVRVPERRASAGTIILIVLGIAILGAVGYDAYKRSSQTQQVQQQTVATQTNNQQLQRQLQDALDRVSQADQVTVDTEQERVMWMTLAKASVSAVSVRPPTLYSLQRAVFGSADAQTRGILREYFKKGENLDKVTGLVVFVSSVLQPGPMSRAFIAKCQPLFNGPLPEESPNDPDALYCYEFLKRREAEGGDVAAWQRLLAAATAEMEKKS